MTLLIQGVLLDGHKKDIYINKGIIEEISERCTRNADRIINGKDKVALPSLINGHTHAAMTLLRGYADHMPLKEWLEGKIWPLGNKMTADDIYWGSKFACLEMIKNGITVFNDMYWFWESTAKAVYDMGIRGFLSAVFIDMFDIKKSMEQIEYNIEIFELSDKYRPNVTFTLGPHAIYTVSKESLQWVRDFSEKHNILVHMHLSETDEETRFSQDRYGLSPTEFLDDIGVLSDRFIGCHGCWLDDRDCGILKRNSAKLVHMPVSNLKLSVGRLFPYRHIKNVHNVPFCFGTDGCASNNHLDLIETMKFASLLAKFSTNDPTMLSAKETFDIATKAAANIFFLPEWEIKIGNSPDIILVDTKKLELKPGFDIFSDIVYASNGYIVDTVICMGKVLMEDRYVPGEEDIIEEFSKTAHRLATK